MTGRRRGGRLGGWLLAAALLAAGCGGGSNHAANPGTTTGSSTSPTTTTSVLTPNPPGVGIHKIRHVVIIMQENRSFDSYFGTYPGADGIPGLAGNPSTVPCVPNPGSGGCVRPFHDEQDRSL
ncbi:MAG TPA: alkaline phosphatase family protein, partial [Solirubrobacteraceae bacterium]|nr:alkaline phosphatase family protein [Solirubrobacteraceae bacterium]